MRLIKQMKIRTFLIIFILGFILIPIIISTFFSFYHTRNTLQNNYNQNYVRSIFSEMKSDLSMIVSQANNVSLQLNSSDMLIEILRSRDLRSESFSASLEQLFQIYVGDHTSFSFVDYITPEGELIHLDPEVDFPDLVATDYLNNLKRSKFMLYNSSIEIDTEYYCVLGKQLYNYQKGYPLGSILLYINQKNLSSLYENNASNTFFISLNNRIISHTEKKYIGSTLYLPQSESADYSLFKSTDSYTYYEDMFEHGSLTDSLQLSAIISNDSLMKTQKIIIRYIFISLILVIIFAIIFVLFISRKLIKSITNLQENMDTFAENHNYYTDIPSSNEIAVLESSFNKMAHEISSLIFEIESEKDKQALAELKALQSQINPHFLYNALGAISWKAKENHQYEIDDMIISLSTFFRIGLHKGDDMITVAEELQHLQSYLEIETIRFPDLFDVTYDIDPNTINQLIPKIILQPIVENSINHGLRNHNIPNGLIKVKFVKNENDLYFEVTDNGKGFESTSNSLPKSQSEDGGYGLYNVNERLIRYYGENYQLHIQSTPGIGTKVFGNIPLSK